MTNLPENSPKESGSNHFILKHHYDIGDRSVLFSLDGLTEHEVKDLAVYLQFKAENLLDVTISLDNITIVQFLEHYGAVIKSRDQSNLIDPSDLTPIEMYYERESRICGNNWYAEHYSEFDAKYGVQATEFLKSKSDGKKLDGALI